MNERIYLNLTHLHVHSQFSLLEGHISIEQLVQRAVADGLNALALSDTHVLYGAVAFHQACTAVSAETLVDRLAWETQILNMPMSENPIKLVADQTAADVPIGYLNRLKNIKSTIAGVRLPGWTGGRGFYFSDGSDFVVVRLDKGVRENGRVSNWAPVRLTGYWRLDEWGGGWFQGVALHKFD